MGKFIAFSAFSSIPAFITYKAVDFGCKTIKTACSGNIRPSQICCTACVWVIAMLFFYALGDEFESTRFV